MASVTCALMATDSGPAKSLSPIFNHTFLSYDCWLTELNDLGILVFFENWPENDVRWPRVARCPVNVVRWDVVFDFPIRVRRSGETKTKGKRKNFFRTSSNALSMCVEIRSSFWKFVAQLSNASLSQTLLLKNKHDEEHVVRKSRISSA